MNSQPTLLFCLLFLFSILIFSGNIPTSLSESDVRTVTIFVEPPKNNEPPLEDDSLKNDDTPKPRQPPSFPHELPTAFVTGSDYALNSNPILISSQSGISLNNLLIEQIEEWEKDAEHTEDFWSRTDQVIMGNFGVVNALHNPLTENNYHIDGTKYSKNIKSNLDYFVQERGYDINNLESVPNHMVTPKKYDLSRTVAKQWENPLANNLDAQHVRDLRDISPNALDFTPAQEMQMFRESVKTTSFQVVGSLMPKIMVDESMFLPESDSQTTTDNLEIQHVRDLRDIAPNAMDFTPEQEMQMFRESVKTTSFQVVGSLMPQIIVDESMFLPESDSQTTKNNLENSIMNKENNSLGTGTTELKQKLQENTKEEIFQQTAHIKDTIVDTSFDPNYATQVKQDLPLFEILTSIILSLVHVSILYYLNKYYRKSVKQISLISTNQKYDYLSDVESLLNDANSLYKNSHIKDAYEKLSQSIRVFYSNKLNLEKEIVTSDLVPLMKNFKESEKSLIEKSLHLSDMIEFAKHSDNNSEFQRIVEQFTKIVKKEKI